MLLSLNKRLPEETIDLDVFQSADAYSTSDLFTSKRAQRSLHWSISWSDLMMTMFVMFLIMYLFHSKNEVIVEGKQEKNSDETIHNTLTDEKTVAVKEKTVIEEKIVHAASSDDLARIDLARDQTVRIILPGDLLFDPGKTELKYGAKRSLADIADLLKKTTYKVNIVGHTDNIPLHSKTYPSNWELSALRACVVARYLIEEKGIASGRFFISGHSYHMPLKPNTTAATRAANRRVEIVLYREKPSAESGIFDLSASGFAS